MSTARKALHDIVRARHTPLDYRDSRAALEFTDEDPANSSRVILVYTRRSELKTNFVKSPPQNETEWNRSAFPGFANDASPPTWRW